MEPRSLPRTDLETLRRAYEVWNEAGPEAVIEGFYAEDAVYREGTGWPDAKEYRGRDAVLGRMRSLIELVGPMQVRLERLVDVGDGRYVALTEMTGDAANSDAPYTQSFGVVHVMRDGLIAEADYYLDPEDALRAAGLDE
jgi:ketosteroid isomerase-like protein